MGLEYVAEVSHDEGIDLSSEPFYMCTLCDKRLDSGCVADHIESSSHRLKYLVRKAEAFSEQKSPLHCTIVSTGKVLPEGHINVSRQARLRWLGRQDPPVPRSCRLEDRAT